MTLVIGQDSDAVLEDANRRQSTYEQGYTNYGSAADGGPDMTDDDFWVQRARSSYQAGQDWFDISIRRRMEDNMRLFNSNHPRGSRYMGDSYEKRSRLFRPKTRSGVRKIEAAGAAAYFSSEDALTATPPNPRDKMQKKGADVNAELLNYRLQNQIPWFLTCIGGLQDAAKQGVVISRQQWVYREVEDVYDEQIVDALTNRVINNKQVTENRVVADHPDIILRPVENVLFSPAADWRNPLQTSPYLIDQEPFYAGEIIDRAAKGPRGPYDIAWRSLSMDIIRSALQQNYDPVRQAREGYREDRYEEAHSDIQDHDVVWVHHNYMRVNGQELYYATLGTEVMLTNVVPLDQVTPLKERPYVLGECVIETHKTYPAGPVELARPVQEEINDVANLRLDNIRHVISPRYFIKRGTSVDIRSLLRNVAGGVTAMEDPKTDVEIRQIADTTASSYKEQATLSVEMDDLIGGFSQSTVTSNKEVTDRVGNTQMLGESGNQITEMTIRTFNETWVEPVLSQVMLLEQALESDEVVLAIVGQRMDVPVEQVFRMLNLPVKVTVSVGFGATNPQMRLQKVSMAFETLGKINPEWIAKADQKEVVTEVLGAVGFKNAERFFPSIAGDGQQQDPQVAQLMEENEQLKGMLQSEGQKYETTLKAKEIDGQVRLQIEQLKLQSAEKKDMSVKEIAHKVEQGKWNAKLLDIQIEREQNKMKQQELVQQRMALTHTIEMDERQYQMAVQQAEWQQGRDIEEDKIKSDASKATPTMPTGATSVNKPNVPSTTESRPKEPTAPKESPRIASTPKIGNDDLAGVISRGRYGNIPGEEG
jgi:hypothetical protein